MIHCAAVGERAIPGDVFRANLSVFGYRADSRVSMAVSVRADDTRLGSARRTFSAHWFAALCHVCPADQ
jgi:hypothetical protein